MELFILIVIYLINNFNLNYLIVNKNKLQMFMVKK